MLDAFRLRRHDLQGGLRGADDIDGGGQRRAGPAEVGALRVGIGSSDLAGVRDLTGATLISINPAEIGWAKK